MGTTAPARSTLGAMPGSRRGRLERSRGAFDDRGHMHGRPHRAFEQRPAPRRRPGWLITTSASACSARQAARVAIWQT